MSLQHQLFLFLYFHSCVNISWLCFTIMSILNSRQDRRPYISVRVPGVRGVNDSPAWVTPRSLTPKAEMTPPWREWLPYDRDDALPQNWFAAIFRITRCLNFQQICRPTCLSIQYTPSKGEGTKSEGTLRVSTILEHWHWERYTGSLWRVV